MSMPTENLKNQNGYIAIVTALILSALIIAITASISLSAFVGRKTVLNSSLKEESRALADACINVALLKLALDINYAGGETVTVGQDCDIISVTTNDNQKTITVRSVVENIYTNIRRTINANDFSIVSWEEF